MKILIRTDASVQYGSGHVVRCLTLADGLKGNGHTVEFICKNINGNLIDLVKSRGYLTYAIGNSFDSDRQFNWEDDVNEVKNAILVKGIYDWIVVDHYLLDSRWELLMKNHCKKLMVIDDLANRNHSCDLLLDQNYEDGSRYKDLVGDACKKLLGPKFALLNEAYTKERVLRAHPRATISRVFIFFGGSDLFNLTERSLLALCFDELNSIFVDIVIGPSYAHYESLRLLAEHRGRTAIHTQMPHLATLMGAADIAIGAGGVTNWERICVGLPSIIISLADNQELIAKILHQKGIVNYLGGYDVVSVDAIFNALKSEINNSYLLGKIDEAKNLCDGLGVTRVIENMNTI